MINPINKNFKNYNNSGNKISFKSNTYFNFDILTKTADLFVKSQENLSSTRFIQDTATNWLPKAVFARSKEDFAEMSFLEFLESAIFYFASPLLGEKLFRNKVFNKLQPEQLRQQVNNQIANSVSEITNNKTITNEVKNRAIASKAGIVLACMVIPAAEYTLSFAKNLFTLKTFKKSNFNDIANLDKTQPEKENVKQQEQVEKNAKNYIKKDGIISLIGVGSGILLALSAPKSKALMNVSKSILNPGKAVSGLLHKTGINSPKTDKILSGLSLDFSNNNGKLALSKGQLAFTAITGLFGYSKAAEDRGKLDKQEVWTRVPLVVFYTIFGSELFEKGFINILNKKNKCQEILQKGENGAVNVLKRSQLNKTAENIAQKNGTQTKKELTKLIKQKAFVSGVPYLFSLLFMGFSLSAITRLITQLRYNKQRENEAKNTFNKNFNDNIIKNMPEVFSTFN